MPVNWFNTEIYTNTHNCCKIAKKSRLYQGIWLIFGLLGQWRCKKGKLSLNLRANAKVVKIDPDYFCICSEAYIYKNFAYCCVIVIVLELDNSLTVVDAL